MFSSAIATSAGSGPSREPGPRDLFLIANNIDEIGGVQRVGHTLARQFAQRGHRVRLIGVRPFTPKHDYASDDAGYSTHVLGEAGPPGANQVTPHDLQNLNALFGSAETGIVICMQVWAMRWVAAADTAHLRVLGQSHESFMASVGPVDKKYSRYNRIMRLYRNIDCTLLLTRADADHFRRAGLNNTAVLPNPVTMRPDAPADLGAPTIVTMGRLGREKNHHALIEAFALLADDYPEWCLKIFGDGPLADELRHHVSESGLTERVRLMGATEEVEKELLQSSIFALSSDAEGLPIAMLEAMACGVPCVSFDCSPGIREIITDGRDGIVVAPGSVHDLAEGMRRLITDPELRRAMGAAAYVSAARYAPDRILDMWEQLFTTVER
jgi:glycosyltransferase involved in cell wall biosynthesis